MNNRYKFTDELIRAYRVLPADQASMQNHIDIKAWQRERRITYEETKWLHRLNFQLYRTNRNAE